MTRFKLTLSDFPDDVQNILKQRSVDECVPVEVVIKSYILHTTELLNNSRLIKLPLAKCSGKISKLILNICKERNCTPDEALEYVLNEINKSIGEVAS